MTNQKKLLLIDGSSVAFRAFFALYNQIDRFRNNNGLHTNAIYGFHLMLDNLLERIQPTHVLVAFDAGKTTFRTEMFANYKAGRAKTPEEFREQFPYIREMLVHVVSPIMTWLSTRQTTLSVPWLRWLKISVRTIKLLLSLGIKT